MSGGAEATLHVFSHEMRSLRDLSASPGLMSGIFGGLDTRLEGSVLMCQCTGRLSGSTVRPPSLGGKASYGAVSRLCGLSRACWRQPAGPQLNVGVAFTAAALISAAPQQPLTPHTFHVFPRGASALPGCAWGGNPG